MIQELKNLFVMTPVNWYIIIFVFYLLYFFEIINISLLTLYTVNFCLILYTCAMFFHLLLWLQHLMLNHFPFAWSTGFFIYFYFLQVNKFEVDDYLFSMGLIIIVFHCIFLVVVDKLAVSLLILQWKHSVFSV